MCSRTKNSPASAVLGTASAYIAPETLRFARACCLEVIIPAGVTPLLQVADVFVFASVKQRLSQEFQRMRVTQAAASSVLVCAGS